MKQMIDAFIRHLEVERGLSQHTLRAYRKDLEAFQEYAQKEAADIELLDVRGFVAKQIRDGLSKTTAGRRLAAVRSFLGFLTREGYLKTNPAKLVTTPKAEKRLPTFLTVDDVFALVERTDTIGFIHARDRAILELLYGQRRPTGGGVLQGIAGSGLAEDGHRRDPRPGGQRAADLPSTQ